MDNKDFHKGIRCTKLAREYTRLHLAQHGWNIADAYNRLSVGKGLISAIDKEAMELYRKCIIQIRRCGMPTIENKANVPELAAWSRKHLNPWRYKVSRYIDQEIVMLEAGQKPKYLGQLRAFTEKNVTAKTLDTYYLLKIQGEKDTDKVDDIIKDLLSKKPEQLALYASTVEKEHQKVTYDSRYTIRCRLNEMPTFGGNTGVKMNVNSDGESYETEIRFSDYARDILNYIYDIPGTADRRLIAFLKDNLKAFVRLREHLAAVAKMPAMDKTTMQDTIDSLNLELDSFAWPS